MLKRPRVIPILSVSIALIAILIGYTVHVKRQQNKTLSDVITVIPEGKKPENQVLLPLLEHRIVVAPDRPHNPGDLPDPGTLAYADSLTRRREFLVDTNSIGLRGPEVEIPAQKYRIICSGDSITFGWGVAYEESWPVRLAAELDVDTVIGAWPAANPEDLLIWIRNNAKALDADLVLFTWGPGEAGETLDRYIRDLEETSKAIAPVRLAWVIPPSGTFDPLGMKNTKNLYPKVPGMIPSMAVLDLSPAFRAAQTLPGVLAEFDGDTQRMIRVPDGKVLLEVKAPPVHPEFGELLAQEFIDAFEADPNLREPLFFDQGHPDAEGFKVFSREVARWIRSQGWVD